MAIKFSKYININSQVVGTPVATARQLILRLFTTNPLVPTSSFIEFNTPAEVGAYFGTSSEEYARAVKYFSWVSKNYTQADTISYASYTPADEAPLIFGTQVAALATFQSIVDGTFSLSIGVVTHILTAIDFSAAASLANVASILQSAITAQSGFSGATVSYDNTRGSFNFMGGTAGNFTISATTGGVGTQILDDIGWNAANGAIFSDGLVAQSITETLTNSADQSNNFGSFAFIPYLALDDAVEAATWNDTLDPNVQYLYSIAPTMTDVATYEAALSAFGGTVITVASPSSADFADQYAPQVLAATDYTQQNSVQDYMYQQFPGDTPSVTDSTTAAMLDAINVNYLGQTQQAGQPLNFYQNGVMQGISTDPSDINVYVNEIWLKDAINVSIMTLLLSVGRVPANRLGVIQLLGVIQTNIDQALFNGMISVDKPLIPSQIAAITNISGDPTAWYQVQNSGYWINGSVDPVSNKFSYTLIYSKDDVIKFVVGNHYLV